MPVHFKIKINLINKIINKEDVLKITIVHADRPKLYKNLEIIKQIPISA